MVGGCGAFVDVHPKSAVQSTSELIYHPTWTSDENNQANTICRRVFGVANENHFQLLGLRRYVPKRNVGSNDLVHAIV